MTTQPMIGNEETRSTALFT